ncbi:hypothetical protein [Amycolatopsis sp. CA-128772]|uniref:hypothetical protein n=1 Tax=Amycolatopsis sp. CA-128772 TaxID=2073159 RepID=UPI000CD2556B|nr:hypothetical protein [Amycolatopsis sp. CA-128772]
MRGTDQPTVAEVTLTRTWLARRGIKVQWPTRLLALRVGSREQAQRTNAVYGIFVGLVWAVIVLPPVPVPAKFVLVSVVFTGHPMLQWRRVRARERLAARLAPPGPRLPWRVAAAQVGWWNVTSVLITYGGGVVLCAARFATSPPAAAGWAVALALGAAGTVLVLGPVLRNPVIAEDEASLAVDAALRAYDALVFAPAAVLTLLAWIDLDATWPAMPPWFPVRVAYIVLAVGTLLAGRFSRRYRTLPPGTYGTAAG